jgi:hypothetical protein
MTGYRLNTRELDLFGVKSRNSNRSDAEKRLVTDDAAENTPVVVW